MRGKPNILRSSLKMTIPQPLLNKSKPLDIQSKGIALIFSEGQNRLSKVFMKLVHFPSLF